MAEVGRPTVMTEETVKQLEAEFCLSKTGNRYIRKGMDKEQISAIRKINKLNKLDDYRATSKIISARNYEQRKEYTKKWVKEHPFHIKIARLKYRKNKRLNSDGTVTKEAISNMLIAQENKCNICNRDISHKYHIDHIIPISKLGAHSILNIQILCVSCNCSKKDKIYEGQSTTSGEKMV